MTGRNSELRSATRAMIERVGVDTTTPATGIDSAVWSALTEAGFTGIGIPEDHDGSGGTLTEVLAVVSTTVTGGALTMLIEHTVLAGRLAARCGIPLGTRTATIAYAEPDTEVRETGDGGWVLHGSARAVVHGADVDRLVVLLDPGAASHGPTVAVLSPTGTGVNARPGTDLLGAAVTDYDFDAVAVEAYAVSPVGETELRERGALAYAVALAAAARAVCDRTVEYAGQRTQFGRPLSKFQAVQQRLAGMAALTGLMETATEAAVAENAGTSTGRARTAIAAAKAVTSSSAREIASAGHQLHGAIGFTAEHPLGRSTTALLAWRERYGSERYWAGVLAGRILEGGVDVWDLVTGFEDGTGGAATERNDR
ncbi:acyl-CoA dehydrogenase family protein [Nocardia paucivorans]|uniref:acyl-CoA dehydrogenase family protein n=1 Tax=Nocardia paucivorans TaxID=114259 RepID=UPI0002F1BBCE|nr:acyl-CoA dehydrogenase family protein [Nocardia paucivorans]